MEGKKNTNLTNKLLMFMQSLMKTFFSNVINKKQMKI